MKPSTLIPHPAGGLSYGQVPHDLPHGLPGGDIYLKAGEHWGPGRGFGVAHIWAAHEKDLVARGIGSPEAVAHYVASIIRAGTPIYCEFATLRSHRLAVLKSATGLLIIEHKPLRQAPLAYSVVTAYPRNMAHGVLVGKIEKAP